MRILITGGAGFIGSHLAERLLAQGHEINVLDNFTSGQWTTAELLQEKGAEVFSGDCREKRALMSTLQMAAANCDFIYHLAATVGVKRVLEDPKACIENNIDSLRAVLSLGIPGIFASTSEVYGTISLDLAENAPFQYSSQSRWSYAASKLIGEYLVQQTPGWKSVRFFNIVGPRQNMAYGAVLPTFVKQCLAGEPMTVYGDGQQVRTFLDVRDCAEILDGLRDKDFDVVNVGGDTVATIDALASAVWTTLRPDEQVIQAREVSYADAYPAGFDECRRRVPDLTKLNTLLPQRSKTPFTKTICDLAESLQPEPVISAV
jgi:UDP-glucose 4-epimerase